MNEARQNGGTGFSSLPPPLGYSGVLPILSIVIPPLCRVLISKQFGV